MLGETVDGVQVAVDGGAFLVGKRDLLEEPQDVVLGVEKHDLTVVIDRGYHVDHAVLTVRGIDAENGLTNYEVETASLARATMRQATSTTVLADSQKMGRTALAKVCDLVNVDRVVTDREPRPEIRRAMEAADVELIVADRDA